MLKVLLVDDEFIVRQGLKSLINWEEYGMNVIADTANGESALQMMHQESFDIVITDIRMPIIDGIELTRIIMERYPGTKVILLTCYSDFEYVKEALDLGASGYLLKTDTEDGHLEKNLRKIKKEFEEERANAETLKEVQKRAETSTHVLRENYVRSLLEKDDAADDAGGCEHVGLQFLKRRHMIWKIEFERMGDQSGKETEAIFQQILADDGAFIFQIDRYGLIAFSPYPAEISQTRIYEWEKAVTNAFFSRLRKIGNVNLFYNTSPNIQCLPKKYTQISQVVQFFTFYHGFNFLVDAKDVTIPRPTDLLETIKWNEIKEMAIARDWNKMKETCHTIFQFVRNQPVDIQSVKLWVIEMIVTIVNELPFNRQLIGPWGNNKFDYIEKAKEKRTFAHLIEWFYDGIDELEKNRSMFIGGHNQMISSAIEYIEKNYHQEITLEELSKHVGLSKSYLSTTFKRVSGKSFTDYVNDLRIEKAKQLLLQIDLRVFEVAEKVGFKDPKYFTKLFKKIEGVSPKHFIQKKCVKNQ